MASETKGSGRYFESNLLTFDDENNNIIQYLSRRFIPLKADQNTLGVQEVQPGDRPDLLAYRAYGNSLSYYHIADYNLSMNPFTLTTIVGRLLVVPTITT